jgi:hypothetical protein
MGNSIIEAQITLKEEQEKLVWQLVEKLNKQDDDLKRRLQHLEGYIEFCKRFTKN